MDFKNLTITRVEYGPDKGQLKAKIIAGTSSYLGNEITLEIPEEVAITMLKLAAPHIVEAMNIGLARVAQDAEAVLLGKYIEQESE